MFQSIVVYTFSALLLFFLGKNSRISTTIRRKENSAGFKSFIVNPGIVCSNTYISAYKGPLLMSRKLDHSTYSFI